MSGVRTLLGVLVGGLIVCASAPAQQSTDQWSLEALTAQAKVVFRGVITNILELPAESKPGGPAMKSLMLTVSVQEKIKGRPDSWMTLMRDTVATDGRYDLYMKAKTPLLWFTFNEGGTRAYPGADIGPGLPVQPGYSWTTVHLGPAETGEAAFDPHAGAATFGMDLGLLKEGKDKIDAVRKFLKAEPDLSKVCRVPLPMSIAATNGYTSGPLYIVLPATPEMGAIATKMVSNPESFLPKDAPASDKTMLRASGTKALESSKSK